MRRFLALARPVPIFSIEFTENPQFMTNLYSSYKKGIWDNFFFIFGLDFEKIEFENLPSMLERG